MKALKLIITVICLIFVTISSFSQPTKEQIKEAEEAQKKAMEMMQKNPMMKDFMKQIQTSEIQRKVDDKKENEVAEKKAQEDRKNYIKEFYWRNKVASNTNGKFKNWTWGAVEIGYYNEESRRDSYAKKYIILGRISNDGLVTMNLPETVKRNRIISNGLLPEMHELTNDKITFSNPNTPYLYYGFALQVIKEDKPIGYITIGNSERTTHNLTVPHMQRYGDIGYLLYWAYTAGECTATADISRNGTFYEGEAAITLDTNIKFDMNFKHGWNLIKISVDDYSEQANQKWFTKKIYSTIPSMSADARYYFKYDD